MVFQGASGLRVYGKRGGSASGLDSAPGGGGARRGGIGAQMGRPLGELRAEAVVSGTAPGLESCEGAGETRAVERGQSRVAVDIRMGCRGMVILADTFAPGWVASVDGAPTRIYETYGAVRGGGGGGGRAQSGPASVFVGGGLTGLGVVLLGGVVVWERRRKRP